jgi:rhodanese-related sulfurtransferase
MDLTQEEWERQIAEDKNAVVLDVRTEDEWNEGIIPGAMMVDIHRGQGFIDEINDLDRNKNYYVYCKSGGRSKQACQIMNQMGFHHTYNLLGGFSAWQGSSTMPD